jgi:hypothetical protein
MILCLMAGGQVQSTWLKPGSCVGVSHTRDDGALMS